MAKAARALWLRHKAHPPALATRLTLWYVGLLAVLLVIFGLLVNASLYPWLYGTTIAQLGAQAASLRQAMQTDTGADRSLSAVAARAIEGIAIPNVWVVVVTRDGQIAARAGGLPQRASEVPAAGIAVLARGLDGWSGTFEGRSGRIAAVLLPLSETIPVLAPPTGGVGTGGQTEEIVIVGRARPLEATPAAGATLPQVPFPPLMPRPPVGPSQAPPVPPGVAGNEGIPSDTWPALAHGFIQVSTPLTRIEDTLLAVRVLLIAGSIVTLMIAGLVGPRLTRAGLRPLRTIARASHFLAAGDLSARVPPAETEDEVGELTRAFNDMAGRLADAFAAQEAAIAAQRALVADASHELRSPLTALGGQLDVLRRAMVDDPHAAAELVKSMRREVMRMSRLVEDLLTLARIDAQGSQALRHEAVSLHAIARDVYEQARVLPSAQGKDVQLAVLDTVTVLGDPVRLHQVLLNLMSNAVEHTPAGGVIALSLVRHGDRALVRVRDTGPGIAPDHLPHIFDRFYRADSARARDRGGAGLGLAISRAIVEAHGGHIAAANAPDGGAELTVALPLAA